MQTTIRYLAGDRIFLPEGFLTACNVIESIGKAAPNSNADLPQLLKTIAKSLKKVDPGLASRFNDEVRIKISTHSSFKDRFDHVKAMLDDLGTPVALEHTALREARGAYRHDVVALKPEHLDAMRAGIGLAWFLGLVWLCQEIGVPKQVLQECAGRDLFHRARGTALALWGKRSPA